MSYVKALVVIGDEAHVIEAHGSEFRLNEYKDSKYDFDTGETTAVEIPRSVKTGEDYRRFAREKGLTTSGTKSDRFDRGIATVETDSQARKYMEYLEEMHDRGSADAPPEGYPFNMIIDLDEFVLYDSKDEWYADYLEYLPEGWEGHEVDAEEMKAVARDCGWPPMARRPRVRRK